jgi:GNAT superfamily N-acetyltransferase
MKNAVRESQIELRLAVPGDYEPIAALVVAFAVEEGRTVDRDAVEEALRHCVDDPAHLLLVAADGAQIAGYLTMHWIPFPMLGGSEAYISDLLVARARRGGGIGRALAEAAEQAARQRGCQRLVVNNRLVAESFVRGFYPKLDYRARDEYRSLVKVLTQGTE